MNERKEFLSKTKVQGKAYRKYSESRVFYILKLKGKIDYFKECYELSYEKKGEFN
jgi:hypothetical protein